MARLEKAGLAPPPETATVQELAQMHSELQAKVDEMTAHLDQVMKQLEAK